jgi:hypothetical protein
MKVFRPIIIRMKYKYWGRQGIALKRINNAQDNNIEIGNERDSS